MKPIVIDLSHHNTIPDSLKDTAQSGVIGLIHKATEGGSYVDPTVGARQYLATDAGLLWGLYHFLRPGDQVAHANHFCDVAEVYGDSMTLLAADYEDYEVSLTDLIVWLLVVEQRMGRRPVIYSGHVLKDKLEGKTYPLLDAIPPVAGAVRRQRRAASRLGQLLPVAVHRPGHGAGRQPDHGPERRRRGRGHGDLGGRSAGRHPRLAAAGTGAIA